MSKPKNQTSEAQNSVRNVSQKPLEVLLIGASQEDPFPVIVVDPRTGVSLWSYKGSELQRAVPTSVVPLGSEGEHFLIAVKDRPLINCVAVHNADRFHAKSVVAGNVTSMVTSRDGSLLFASIGSKIFVWLLVTGELLTTVDAHYQQISRIQISADEAFLFSVSDDGATHVYLVSELISSDRNAAVKPIRKWQSHTLPIKGLSVSRGQDPRIATCGADHIAHIHSISLNTSLLKISADRPLTCCVLDPAESRLFLGSDLGNIAQINLYNMNLKTDILIQTSDERNESIPVFNGHSDEISALCLSGDAVLLASGDITGKYCIWEIGSRQCLKVSTMRGIISTLSFIPNWPSFAKEVFTARWRPAFDLQRQPTNGTKIHFQNRKTDVQFLNKFSSLTDRLLEGKKAHHQNGQIKNQMIKGVNNDKSIAINDDEDVQLIENSVVSTSQKTICTDTSSVEEKIKTLLEENQRLRKVNAELYRFSANQILKTD